MPAHPKTKPLYRNLSFTLMWTSTAASGFGDRMIMLGALALLGGMIAGADSTATQASTQFWFFLPYIGFSLLGGWLADHLPRKWLLMLCDESRGLILIVAAVLAGRLTGTAAVPGDSVWFTLPGVGYEVPARWQVYAGLFAVGTFAAVFNPTRNAIIPQIIPTPQLAVGNAVILVINVIASQIGLLIGKAFISQEDAGTVQLGLALGAGFYIVSGVFFAFLRPVQQAHTPVTDTAEKRSLLQAVRYLRDHRRVVKLIALNILVWPSAAVVTSALFGLGKRHYGLDGDALLAHFANLSVALGVGMLIGAAIISFIRVRKESPIVYLSSLAVAGIGIVLLAAVPWLPAAYAACLLIGIAGNMTIVAVLTMVQSITPNYMRGRVMGLNALVTTMFSVLTYLAIWLLPNADATIIPVLFTLGPALVVIGGIGLVRFLRSGPIDNKMANLFWRLERLWVFVLHRVRFVGRHHVPHEGPVVLASNHTTALDPFVLQAGIKRKIRWMMLTPYLFKIANPLWKAIEPIALDRDSSDAVKLRKVAHTLRDGEIVGMFPEGGLQRTHRQLQPFEPGTAVMAKLGKAVIVPAWVDGTPLAEGMLVHLLKPSRVTVTFGEPFKPAKDASPEQVMEELRERMLALAPGKTQAVVEALETPSDP